jgi:hypothetical protein
MMRRTLTTGFLVGVLLIPASAALADNSGRAGGTITTPESPTPANGGDQGWGNCGHNSSGGNAHTGDNGTGGGNVGDAKASCIRSHWWRDFSSAVTPATPHQRLSG